MDGSKDYSDGSFPWNLLCRVVMALDFCHCRVCNNSASRLIIGPDLKPEKVCLGEDNVFKVGPSRIMPAANYAHFSRPALARSHDPRVRCPVRARQPVLISIHEVARDQPGAVLGDHRGSRILIQEEGEGILKVTQGYL